MNHFKRDSSPSGLGGCRHKGRGNIVSGFAFYAAVLAVVGMVLPVSPVSGQSTPLTETNDITQVDPYANPMKLMQANGYAHRVYARVGRTPFLLTNSGTFGIWWLRDFNVSTSYWLMATGTVRDATNGLMGFDVGPSQMQLPATSYWSIVRAYRSQAGVTTEIANLSYRLASVTATPEGAAQALVSPGSWPVNIDVSDLSGAVMSNQLGRGFMWNSATTNWETEAAAAAGDYIAQAAGYGTNTALEYPSIVGEIILTNLYGGNVSTGMYYNPIMYPSGAGYAVLARPPAWDRLIYFSWDDEDGYHRQYGLITENDRLSAIGDVAAYEGTVALGDVLTWNGAAWSNAQPSAAVDTNLYAKLDGTTPFSAPIQAGGYGVTNIAWLWFTNATGLGYGKDAGGTNVQISVVGTNTWYIRLPL